MGARITKDQGQRTLLSVFCTFFGFGGAAAIGSVTLNIVEAVGGGRTGWMITGLIYGVLGMVLYLFCFAVCKELPDDFTIGPDAAEDKPAKQEPVQSGEKNVGMVYALFHNKYWLIIMAFTLLSFISTGLGGANVYYAQFILGSTDYMGLLTICGMAPMAFGALIVTPLVSKFGAWKVCFGGTIMYTIGVAVLFIAPASPVVIAVGLIIKGLGGAAIAVTGFAMMADTVEYSEWKFGVRPDGLTYSAVTFGEKVGAALGTVIVSGIMTATGYVGQAATQSSTALFGLKVIFIYVPLVMGIIEVILMSRYDLDKNYAQILKDLEERRKAH